MLFGRKHLKEVPFVPDPYSLPQSRRARQRLATARRGRDDIPGGGLRGEGEEVARCLMQKMP